LKALPRPTKQDLKKIALLVTKIHLKNTRGNEIFQTNSQNIIKKLLLPIMSWKNCFQKKQKARTITGLLKKNKGKK
jgi:hypothetical protein